MNADAVAQGPTVPMSGSGAGVDEVVAAGTTAGEYVIERAIGAGGMGQVYAGRHPVIGKRVAVKVLRRELAAQADAAERFLREAQAANQIEHPNVVDVFALGRLADGRLYLVMDLLDGESLREVVRRGAMAPARALDVLGQVADAIDAAHARGVVHRDLKPDNVMLTGPAERPTARVLDFGIAKLIADAKGDAVATLTGQGAWMGTPAYMAPEQWTAEGATAASDRYALGVLAYELLTGKPPFVAPSLPAMMEQHFRGAVPSVTTAAGAALPSGLDTVFAQVLAKEPARRPPTARAVVDALAAALAGRVAAPRSGRGVWVGAAAAVVALAGGGVLVVGGGERGASPRAPSPPKSGVAIVTTPPGATVTRGGERAGETPLTIPAAAGTTLSLTLSLPGHVAVAREVAVAAGEPIDLRVELARSNGFDGLWRLPTGELRAFERRDDQVAGFVQKAPTEARVFLRFFAFVPSAAGTVAFAATEPFVAEELPDEPSCHIPLRAEYVYRPGGDELTLRRERARYTVRAGRCVLEATAWSEPAPLTRVATATSDGEWAESRAGVGTTPPVIGKDPPQVGGASADEKPGRKPTGKPRGKAGGKGLPPDVQPDALSPGSQQTSDPRPNDQDNVQGDGAANQPAVNAPPQPPQQKVPPPAQSPQQKAPPPIQSQQPQAPPTKAD